MGDRGQGEKALGSEFRLEAVHKRTRLGPKSPPIFSSGLAVRRCMFRAYRRLPRLPHDGSFVGEYRCLSRAIIGRTALLACAPRRVFYGVPPLGACALTCAARGACGKIL